MTIEFYKNSSPINYVNKSITLTDNLNCELKENCSVIEPIIEVYDSNALNANYMYIPLFSRYYFITDITTTQYNTIIVTGHVDVLMSFKNAILNAQGVIARNQYLNTPLLDDNKAVILAEPEIRIKKFNSGFLKSPNYALIVSGGYNSFIN